MQGREQQTPSTAASGRQRRATTSCKGQPFWKKRGNGVPSTEGTQNTPPTPPPPYLGRGAGGEVGQVPDPGSRPRVAGADEDGCADLHGVPVAGGLGGLVRHAKGSEGMAFLGVLLALRLTLGCPGRPGTGQRGARCQTRRRRRRLRGQRDIAAGGSSRARLVHLDELLGGFIQLGVEEKGKTKKKKKKRSKREKKGWCEPSRLAWWHLLNLPGASSLQHHNPFSWWSTPAKACWQKGCSGQVPKLAGFHHLSTTSQSPRQVPRRHTGAFCFPKPAPNQVVLFSSSVMPNLFKFLKLGELFPSTS